MTRTQMGFEQREDRMKKEYHKLIRDRIPEIIAANGQSAEIRILSDAEYTAALEKKLTEEVAEYLESKEPMELADILEVVQALAQRQGVSFDRLLEMKDEKQGKNGAFLKKLFLESVETTEPAHGQVAEESILIESVDPYNESLGDWIDRTFDAFAEQNGVICNYTPFAFVAKQNGKVIGVIKGHSFYREVHIGELIVAEDYRGRGIGMRLLAAVEDHFRGKGFDNVNLTTYRFQAPEFYQKCGFTLEFIRENQACPALDKFFFIKEL